MSSINAFAVSGSGFVRVEVDWSDIAGPPRKCWAYRVIDGVSTLLRGGDPLLLSGGRGIVYDTEAPLDTAVSYRSVIALNLNGDFEGGVDEWLDTSSNGTVGTVTQSFDYYLPDEGRASLKLVSPGGAATVRAVSEYVPATAGVTYSFQGSVLLAADWAGGTGIQVHWYNGTTYLSASGAMNDLWPTKGAFGTYSFAATAPASTTSMRVVAGMTGTPPAGLTAYVDEVYITRSGVTTINTAGTVTLTSDDKGWWKDPLHPATMVRLLQELPAGCVPAGTVYGGLGTRGRAADSALLDVNDAPSPVSTWGARKAGQSQMLVGTASLADLAAVEALHASGAPLLLQLPSVYGVADHYQQHGDLSIGYLGPDQRRPFRRVQSGFAEVEAPVGEAEGVLGVRYEDINRWVSLQEAGASGGGGYDSFGRTVVDDWGTSDSGIAWTESGTAADFDVANFRGTMRIPAVSTTREAYYPVSLSDVRVQVGQLGLSAAPTGTTEVTITIRARFVNVNNYVDLRIFRNASGTVTTAVRQMVAGVETFTFSAALSGITSGQELSALLEVKGGTIWAKVWASSATMPSAWTVSQATTHLTAGSVMLGALTGSGVSNTPITASFGSFAVTSLAAGAGNTWWDILQGEGHV